MAANYHRIGCLRAHVPCMISLLIVSHN